jgi:hypothetical protein
MKNGSGVSDPTSTFSRAPRVSVPPEPQLSPVSHMLIFSSAEVTTRVFGLKDAYTYGPHAPPMPAA